jgi:CBS domain-containing protein
MTGLTVHLPKQLSRRLPKSLPTHLELSLPSLPKPVSTSLPRGWHRYVLPVGVLLGSAAAAVFFGYRARGSGRTVGEVMVEDVLTVDASAPLWKAAQRMRDGNVGVLPVVEDGKLRGIVTDRDLVIRGLAEGADPTGMRVGDCATWDIVCARADSPIEEAMEVMAECQIGRLPVVDPDNRVIGIVTLSSLALRSRKKEDALQTAQEVSKRSARAAA